MRLETKLKLLEKYNSLKNIRSTTAIKYLFQYNGVNVNIYFDAYDENNLSLCVILKLNKEYYYTSLNIQNTDIKTEYLYEIPLPILNAILDENRELKGFFNSIENHILNTKCFRINYDSDKDIFARTLKYNNHRKDLPFISHIRKVPMSDETFNNLIITMGISKEILCKIRDNKATLIRTDKPEKRKNITLILEELNIVL